MDSVWRDNYPTARANEAETERQVEEHVARGLAFKLSPLEARCLFPKLCISSLGAVTKTDSVGVVTGLRIVMDGTHGVEVNSRIRVRDQDQCPIAADVKRVQRAQAREAACWGLAVDVKEAHRLPVVRAQFWEYQACRARQNGSIYLCKCGLCGIACIACWWSRIGAALVRWAHFVAVPSDGLWLL